MVTASDDDTARLWDARTGAELAVLEGHVRLLTFAFFSLDGARVITVSLITQSASGWWTNESCCSGRARSWEIVASMPKAYASTAICAIESRSAAGAVVSAIGGECHNGAGSLWFLVEHGREAETRSS